MPGKAYQNIYEIALDQYGLVTASQAKLHRVTAQALSKMVQRGTLERRSKGLYRVTSMPSGQLGEFMEAVLWINPLLGTISHESALDIFDVSDVNPSKIHVTVPKAYRTHRSVPRGLQLHRADLKARETIKFEGIPVTTLERAIQDCLETHLGSELLMQAVEIGRSRGRLSESAAGILTDQILGKEVGR